MDEDSTTDAESAAHADDGEEKNSGDEVDSVFDTEGETTDDERLN